MKVAVFIFLLAGLLAFSGVACAEGSCPSGSYPIGGQGAVGCAPIPTDDESVAMGSSVSARPAGKWKTMWGAIYADSVVGDIGAANGEQSKNKAKRLAEERCKKHGAKECELLLVYSNQCGALAWPSLVGAKVTADGGLSADAANDSALQKCARSGGGVCKIVYSECSKPVFESFR